MKRGAAMTPGEDLLIRALRQPDAIIGWPLADLDMLVRQARHANLLARFGALLDADALRRIPAAPRAHFEAAAILAEKHRRDVMWEIRCLHRILSPLTGVVLLKGAAYTAAGLRAARGRIFSDIDLLVPKERIDVVERALSDEGWVPVKLDAYDQFYYRTWMHQIPPLMHFERETVIDVHHAIVPDTARARIASAVLMQDARPLAAYPGFGVLAPVDMVLHSAVHLFNGGEYDFGLRDLCDIHDLLDEHGAAPGFWDSLWRRAADAGMTTPVALALRYAHDLFGAALPRTARDALEAYERDRPAIRLLRSLIARAVRPNRADARDSLAGFARWLLYVRGHYLRMPLRLLVPHLVRKAVQARLSPSP